MDKTSNRKLYKSKDNRVLAGVMGGIGEYFNIDPTLLRIGYIFISVFSAVFPGIIVYILMALVIPERPKTIHKKAK